MTDQLEPPLGAAVGAVAGAMAGKAMNVDPKEEDAYWRSNYADRPYVTTGSTYDDYGPARTCTA